VQEVKNALSSVSDEGGGRSLLIILPLSLYIVSLQYIFYEEAISNYGRKDQLIVV
jgi:hypothetical protein